MEKAYKQEFGEMVGMGQLMDDIIFPFSEMRNLQKAIDNYTC